jgi:hypothetical protein
MRRHLAPSGVGVLDFWYGPAVLSLGPSQRTVVFERADGSRLVRITSGVLDSSTHTCAVTYRVIEFADGECCEVQEHHLMRYFFPLEFCLLLRLAGLELVKLLPAPCEGALELGLDTWNALAVVRPTSG